MIAILENGDEQVINRRTFIHEDDDADEVTGTVSTNPMINNADVKLIQNGNVVSETKTDTDGEYSLVIDDYENAFISVAVNGFEHPQLDRPLFAGAKQPVQKDGTVDFTFNIGINTIVNNDEISVSNKIEENTNSKIIINNIEQLQSINENLDQDYELGTDIDASNTENWNDGKGFKPIGAYNDEFTGTFDGNGFEINNIHINRPNEDNVGLFGVVTGDINNIHINDVYIVGDNNVGGIVGNAIDNSNIDDSSATGDIIGNSNTDNIIGSDSEDANADIIGDSLVTTEGDYLMGIVDVQIGDSENIDIDFELLEDELAESSIRETTLTNIDSDGEYAFEINTEDGDADMITHMNVFITESNEVDRTKTYSSTVLIEESKDATARITEESDLTTVEGDNLTGNINVNMGDANNIDVDIELVEDELAESSIRETTLTNIDSDGEYAFEINTEDGDSNDISEIRIIVTEEDENDGKQTYSQIVNITESTFSNAETTIDREESESFDGEQFTVQEGGTMDGQVDIQFNDEDSATVDIMLVDNEGVIISKDKISVESNEDSNIQMFSIETSEGDAISNAELIVETNEVETDFENAIVEK